MEDEEIGKRRAKERRRRGERGDSRHGLMGVCVVVGLNIPTQARLFISLLSQLLAGREAICQSVQPISPK